MTTPEIEVSREEFEATVFVEHAIAGHGHSHERMEWIEFDNATDTAHYTTDSGVHLVAHLPHPKERA